MKVKKIISLIFIMVAFACIFIFVAINLYVVNYAKPFVYKEVDGLPEKYTVIVLGAKVYKDNVSHVVRDRIEGALRCINANKAERILVSGDHGRKSYDEVNQIRLYMQKNYGTDGSIIFMDHAGFSTYETMYRARDVFCVKDAIIVTQKFHIYRSVYIARKLGLDAFGLEAPEMIRYSDRLHRSWEFRECLARVKAFFYVMLNVNPKFLGEKIPITGNSKASWD